MSQWLKQSMAATIPFGPFVDATDGVTAETALTIAQADIRLSKNGGAFAQSANVAGATHMENGVYSVPLDTTDTNTLGRLRVMVAEAGALPVWQDFLVVPANEYDSLVLGTDALDVEVASMAADVMTAAAAAADLTTELQSGLATAAALSTVAGYIDTEVAAIKAKTDSLTFTVAGQVDANIQSVNDVTVNGAGTAISPWAP